MADKILLKRSSTASAVPTAAQIEPGELATNTADGKVYARKGAAVVEVTDWPSADVVPQPEAETGTATTARKWTALRVRQAIAAWWNGVTSAFGRSFVAAADATAGRAELGLGTAATADVTTSVMDTTAGRLLKVGDFGIGALAFAPSPSDLNSIFATGIYRADNGASYGLPVDVVALHNHRLNNTSAAIQQAFDYLTPRNLIRAQAGGTWSSWVESYTTGNLIYAQLSSGTSVAPHATTAGSNLTPAQTGTWRNVSNTVVNTGAYTLWMRV